MSDRILRVMGDRFRIDAAGGVDRARIRQQRSEFVERGKIGRRPPQDVDEGLLGVLLPVQCTQQDCALDLGIDRGSPRRRDAPARPRAASAGLPARAGAPSPDRRRRFPARAPRSVSVRSRFAEFDLDDFPRLARLADSRRERYPGRSRRPSILPNISDAIFEISGSKNPARTTGKRRRRQDIVYQTPTSSARVHSSKIGFMTTSASAIRIDGAEISGAHATHYLHAGLEHYAAGRIDQAMSAYRRGLAVAENGPPGFVTVETISQLHSNLGNACMRSRDLEAAAASYKAALRLAPDLTSCWCNLGNIELRTGNADQAIALYLQALTLSPAHWPTRTNLVQALMATRQYLLAKLLLTELIEERPQDAGIHKELGKLHVALNELEPALECFRRAAILAPGDAEAVYWIGGIRQTARRYRSGGSRLCASRPHSACRQPAGCEIPGGFSRPGAVCSVCGQHRRPNICSAIAPTIPTRWRCLPPANSMSRRCAMCRS